MELLGGSEGGGGGGGVSNKALDKVVLLLFAPPDTDLDCFEEFCGAELNGCSCNAAGGWTWELDEDGLLLPTAKLGGGC